MKTIKLIIAILLIATSTQVTGQTTYTWTGNKNNNWNDSDNWDPSGVPGSVDKVLITGSVPDCIMDQSYYIDEIEIDGSVLDQNSYDLFVTGPAATFSGGTISNGALYITASTVLFQGAAITSDLTVESNDIQINGGSFNGTSLFTFLATPTSSSEGGCTFSGIVKFRYEDSSDDLVLTSTNGNTYNNDVYFINNSRDDFRVSWYGTNTFNGNVHILIYSDGSLIMGNNQADNGGDNILSNGFEITIDSIGVHNCTLILKDFVQQGSTEQDLSSTGTSLLLSIIDSEFEADVDINVPGVLLKNTEFNGETRIEKNGTLSNHWSGGNTFNGLTTILNTSTDGTSELRLATLNGDVFNGDVSFESDTSYVSIAYDSYEEFHGNVTINTDKFLINGGTTGQLIFKGSESQTITGADTIKVKSMQINKSSDGVTLASPLKISSYLNLTSGQIIASTGSKLILSDNATTSGGNDTSYVEGPILKIGNDSFKFPIGANGEFNPLEISAPSISTDEFLSEYIGTEQSLSDSLESGINGISPCGYWNLSRTSGTSDVDISLSWNPDLCNKLDLSDSRIVYYNDTLWQSIGNMDSSNSGGYNKIKSSSDPSQHLSFALAYISNGNSCLSAITLISDQLCADSIYKTTNNVVWYKYKSDSTNTQLTFYNIDNDSTDYYASGIEMYYGQKYDVRRICDYEFSTFRDSLIFTAFGLDTAFSKNRYLKVEKNASCYGCSSDTMAFKFCVSFLVFGPGLSEFQRWENECGLDYSVGRVQLNQRVSNAPAPNSVGVSNQITITAPGPDAQILSAYLYIIGVHDDNSLLNAYQYATIGYGSIVSPILEWNQTWTDFWGGGTCWSGIIPNFFNTSVFKADVTNYINNYTTNYIIDGLVFDNHIDWDGAFLIIVYKDCSGTSRKSSLYLAEGLHVVNGVAADAFVFNNLAPTASNTYSDERSFVVLSDIEDPLRTYFLNNPGPFFPSDQDAFMFGIPASPTMITIETQAGNVMPSLAPYSSSWIVPSFYFISNDPLVGDTLSTDCFDIFFTGVYYQEADVLCSNCSCDEGSDYCITDDVIITTDEIWNLTSNPEFESCGTNTGVISLKGDLIIESDASLDVTDLTLKFSPTSKIIVKRGTTITDDGASLAFHNCLLTSINDRCMWPGIEVWGYRFQSASTPQGIIEIDNGTEIQYAHTGVFFGRESNGFYNPNFTGGLISKLEYSTFTDNNISIEFPYSYRFPYEFDINHNSFQSLAPLRDAKYKQSRSESFISLNGTISSTSNSAITLNSFYCLPEKVYNETVGIAGYKISQHQILENEFTDVNVGILIYGNSSDNIIDQENQFTRNYRGVWLRNSTNNYINDNDFNDGFSFGGGPFAIWNQGAFLSEIRDNRIDNWHDGIANTKTNSNLGMTGIYLNDINTVERGISFIGNNENTSVYCNDLNSYEVGFGLYNMGGSQFSLMNQGVSNLFNPANQFLASSGKIDIDNLSGVSFIYYENFLTPYPDNTTGNTTVNPNSVTTTLCSSLRPYNRPIAEILADRDTSYTDSLLLADLNSEVFAYYLNNYENDSLVNFFDSLSVNYSDKYMLNYYIYSENTDSINAIINRMPDTTSCQQKAISYYEILVEIMEDSLSIYDIDSLQYETLLDLAEDTCEISAFAVDWLVAIDSLNLTSTCEEMALCSEERIANADANNFNDQTLDRFNLIVSPNPVERFAHIRAVNEVINSDYLIYLYTIDGRLIRTFLVTGNESIMLDFVNFESGLYIYKAIEKITGMTQSGKLLKL